MSQDLLTGLNLEQLRAVTWDRGSALVLAGAVASSRYPRQPEA